MPENPSSLIYEDEEPSSLVYEDEPTQFKLPDLPKPKVPGLTTPKAGVASSIEKAGARPGGPVVGLGKVADWMLEGLEEGIPRAYTGYQKALGWGTPTIDERAQGAADVIGGAMDASRLYLPRVAAQLPAGIKQFGARALLKDAAAATILPPLVKEGAKALGAGEGTSNLLSEASGALPVASAVSKLNKAKPFSWTKPTPKSPLESTLEKIDSPLHRAYTEAFNEQHPLWELEKLANIPFEQSAAAKMESFGATTGKVHETLLQFRDKMYKHKKEGVWDDAARYGTLERHAERMAQDPDYVTPGLMSQHDVDNALLQMETDLGPDRMKKIHEALKDYRDISDGLFRNLRDEGIISPEFYSESKKYNQKYIPFQRLEYLMKELANDSIPVGHDFSVSNTGFTQQLKGSEKEIVDPVYGFVRNAYRAHFAIERNKIAKDVANYADTPELGDLIFKVNPWTKRLEDRAGKVINEPIGYKRISYRDGGKTRQVSVPEFIHELMVNKDKQSLDIVTKTLRNTGKFLQAGVVTNPRFWLRNMPRDYLTAVTTTGIDPATWSVGFLASITRGIPSSKVPEYFQKLGIGDAIYRDFLKAGAAYSGPFQSTGPVSIAEGLLDTPMESLSRKLGAPGTAIMDTLGHLGTTAELAPRLAIFQKKRTPTFRQISPQTTGQPGNVAMVEPGVSDQRAGWSALNGTVNFYVEGASAKQINKVVPFLRARMGASRTVAGALSEDPKGSTMRLAGTIGIPAAYIYYSNVMRYPDVWDNLDPEVKRTNLVYIKGRETDEKGRYTNVVTFGMDGVPAAFVTALHSSMDVWRGRDLKEWFNTGAQFLSDFSPVGFLRRGKFNLNEVLSSASNPALTIPYEIATGQAVYSGRDLEKRKGVRMDAAPEERYNLEAKLPYISLSQNMAKAGMRVSPHVLEHVIGSTLFGHWGRDISASMPSVGNPQWTNQLRVNPFIGPANAKPEEGLSLREKEEERGNRLQNIRRAADTVMLQAKDPKTFSESAISTLTQLREKYPDEDSTKLASEFADTLKKLAEAKAKNMNRLETDLLLQSSEVRAEAMLEALQRAPSQSMRDSYITRWKGLKLLTPKVQNELKLIQEKKMRLQAAPQLRQ